MSISAPNKLQLLQKNCCEIKISSDKKIKNEVCEALEGQINMMDKDMQYPLWTIN